MHLDLDECKYFVDYMRKLWIPEGTDAKKQANNN